MSDDRIVSGSDRVLVVERAPEVVYVERERPVQDTHETTIIRGDQRGGLRPSMLLALGFGFLLIAGLIYVMATGGDAKSEKDGLNLSIDVAAPELPAVTVPAIDLGVEAPDVELPDVQIQSSDASVAKTDTAIAPGEPLEPVEPATTE